MSGPTLPCLREEETKREIYELNEYNKKKKKNTIMIYNNMQKKKEKKRRGLPRNKLTKVRPESAVSM